MTRVNLDHYPGLILLFTAAVSLAACDAPPEPGDSVSRLVELDWGTWPPSGGTLNTAWLGDTPLMRIVLPDYPQARYRSDDAVVEEIEVLVAGHYEIATSAGSRDGDLVVTVSALDLRGDALVDSRWWLDVAKTRYITISHFQEKDGHYGYQFDYHVVGEANVKPEICRPDEDGHRWAYMVGDVMVDVHSGNIEDDEDSLLIACASGALGKAISWGFTPWYDPVVRDLDLYRTGVRTVMADYCGDGSSFTLDGTLIQVSNPLAGQRFTKPDTSTEGLFGPQGALCLSNPRIEGASASPCSIPDCDTLEAALHEDALVLNAWTKHAPW